MSDPTPNVTIFSTPTCPWCTHAKNYLQENEVPFKEVDVSKDMEMAMKMIQRSGHQGVPQLWIGDTVIVGFNKEKIDELLEI